MKGSTAMVTEQAESYVNRNMLLAEKRWKPFCEGIDRDWDHSGGIPSDQNKKERIGGCARLLENVRRWMLQEETRGVSIGDFQKYAFPLVRAIFPELIANSIVSVQPMLGPTSLVFYLDFVFASNKGSILAGNKAFESVGLGPSTINYSSETISGEVVGTGNGSTASFSYTLSYKPIKGSTVTITSADASGNPLIATDDGNGNLVGQVTSTNTINYSTGAVVLQYSSNVGSGQPVVAVYDYDMEALALKTRDLHLGLLKLRELLGSPNFN